jgi:DNA-directed RNA polymerase specialized sigma24 family protein
MEITPTTRKEKEVTPEVFAAFLSRLDPVPETAGEKYEVIRRQLIKFFEWRGSFIADRLADETLNRVMRKISDGEEIEKNVLALSLGIARFVLLESMRHPENRRAELEELSALAAPAEHRFEDDDLWVICLRECLRGFSQENRELIIDYYEEDRRAKIDTRKLLAAKLDISINALFSRAKRIRDKLENCVTICVEKKSKRAT